MNYLGCIFPHPSSDLFTKQFRPTASCCWVDCLVSIWKLWFVVVSDACAFFLLLPYKVLMYPTDLELLGCINQWKINLVPMKNKARFLHFILVPGNELVNQRYFTNLQEWLKDSFQILPINSTVLNPCSLHKVEMLLGKDHSLKPSCIIRTMLLMSATRKLQLVESLWDSSIHSYL